MLRWWTGGEPLAISLDFVAYYSPGAGRNLAAGFMVAAAAAEATRGRRLGLFSGLRVPPICLAHECAQVAAAGSAFQRLPGSGTWAFHLCPLSSSPSQPARPFFSDTPLPTPQHRKKQWSLSWISLSLLFGPQMRKTVLPVFGFPKRVRKFREGTLSSFSGQAPCCLA